MIFPEVTPSRTEALRQVTEALRSDKARLYIDSSVLIRCYEMSRSGCDELLAALGLFGARVRVPVWSAKETWDVTRALRTKKPLKSMSELLNVRLQKLRTESLRYVDERTFDDLSLDAFTAMMDTSVQQIEALTRRIAKIEPGHDDANAKLLPFIAEHALSSDMVDIYDEIERTGEMRFSHEVPPGFGDGGLRTVVDDSDEETSPQQKGKKYNRYGDLIMWLEALHDGKAAEADHILILTRDNSKRDWVYKPDRVLSDDGRPSQNSGLITLPLPLLSQEARRRCPTVRGVHVVSLEMFTQIARTSFGARVGNLARALQTTRPDRGAAQRAERQPDPTGEAAAARGITFSSQDMIYEPEAEQLSRPVWQAIRGLRSEGWDAQNDAAAVLPTLVGEASPDDLKQIGRGIVSASNEGAIGPIDLAQQILENPDLPADLRANVLVGMLAETYLDENGEPAKPVAAPEIATLLFTHAADPATLPAYTVTLDEPLQPFRRLYLGLPTDPKRLIRLEPLLSGSTLQGLQADGVELLELSAPETRRISASGGPAQMSMSELIALIAREFVVPASWLQVEGPTNFQVEIPDRMGFIAWGPNTGEQLR